MVLGLAALILAAASAHSSPTYASTNPWWEKVTYTLSDDGTQQACRYESNLAGARSCGEEEGSSPLKRTAASAGSYTSITIERRFSPGDQPDLGKLQSGDTFLGGQVMALAIDSDGAVRSCRVLAASGDVRPAYGCNEARAEKFNAGAPLAADQVHQGYMTILVYGHEGYVA